LKKGKVNLNDPATTLSLLKLNAVVGVKGSFNEDGTIGSIGITCAFCHSTVDDSFAPGIGHRLDGWANRDLNVGAIVSLAPNLQPIAGRLHTDVATAKTVLNSWGPGRFDAELNMDGKAFRRMAKPLQRSYHLLLAAGVTFIPGQDGVRSRTGDAYVAVTQMKEKVRSMIS
jgi:hypothetical protein